MNSAQRTRLAGLVGVSTAEDLLEFADGMTKALEGVGVAFKADTAGIAPKQREFLERLLGPEMAAAVVAGLELQDAATRSGAQAAAATPEGIAVLARLQASNNPAAKYVADLVRTQPTPATAQPAGQTRRSKSDPAAAYVSDALGGRVVRS